MSLKTEVKFIIEALKLNKRDAKILKEERQHLLPK